MVKSTSGDWATAMSETTRLVDHWQDKARLKEMGETPLGHHLLPGSPYWWGRAGGGVKIVEPA